MKKLTTLFLSLLLALTLAVPAAAAGTEDAAAPSGVSVQVNGEDVTFSGAQPEMANGRTMVPMRAVLEALGATVDYDRATKTVTATLGESKLTHVIGTDKITVDGGQVMTMDTASYIKGGSTMVPLRFFSQALNYQVYWDRGERTAVVINKQAVIDEIDKSFTILNGLQAKQAQALSGNLAMELDFSGSAKVLDSVNGDKDFPFSMKMSALYGSEAMNIQGTMDLSIIALAIAEDLEELETEDSQALAELLKNVEFQMIYGGGSLWMEAPVLAEALRAAGEELPEGKVWMDLSGADLGEVYDLYDMSLSSVGGITIGQALYAMVEMTDAEMPVLLYEDLSGTAALLKAMIGDDTFTKSGEDYTWKLDQAVMDKLAGELGASDVSFPGTMDMEMTIKADGSCTFDLKLNMADTTPAVVLELSGSSSTTDSSIQGKVQIQNLCDVTFQGTAKVSASETAPVTAPPAGETVVDLAGVPMPLAA